jgi:membrane-associated phospholipid phosphatase
MLILSYSGLGQVQFLLCLLFLRSKETKYYVLPLLTTILASGLVVAQGLKHLIVRDRPSNLMWVKPQEQFFADSFPSGHTTTSFAIATMLVLLTWRTPRRWLGIGAAIWAPLVGLSRVYRGIHWPTDAMAGACAGVFTSCAIYLILGAMGRQLHLEHDGVSLSGQTASPPS